MAFAAGLMAERGYLAGDSRAGMALSSFNGKGKNENSPSIDAVLIESGETGTFINEKVDSTDYTARLSGFCCPQVGLPV
ncbi:MAG: hypothetical protein ACI845_001075 [Gammaproteobacteria bacterium]